MCEDTMYEHGEYMKFADELNDLDAERRSQIVLTDLFNALPKSSMKDMTNIRYVGREPEWFYLLALRHNTTIVLCQFDIDVIYDAKPRGMWYNSIDVINDEKDRITVRYLSSCDFLYYEFKNMVLSGVMWRFSFIENFLILDGIEMGKRAYYLRCEKIFSQTETWICESEGLGVELYEQSDGYKSEYFYKLLLNIFDKSIRIMKNDPTFISNSIYFMCEMRLMIINECDKTIFTLEKMIRDMSHIILWIECELVKNVENMLRNEIFTEYEPLPIFILRAIVHEYSLLLFRRATQ